MNYRTCPHCGANLDPGEVCDCPSAMFDRLSDENKRIVIDRIEALVAEQKSQPIGNLEKKTAASASNTDSGEETQQDS